MNFNYYKYTLSSSSNLRFYINVDIKEEFEDIKGVIRICISTKNRQHNGQKKKSTKGQTKIYKTHI